MEEEIPIIEQIQQRRRKVVLKKRSPSLALSGRDPREFMPAPMSEPRQPADRGQRPLK